MASQEKQGQSKNLWVMAFMGFLSGHAALVSKYLIGLANKTLEEHEGRHLHEILMYVCAVWEILFVPACAGLVALHRYATWDPWQYTITRVYQMMVITSGVGSFLLTFVITFIRPTSPVIWAAIGFTLFVCLLVLLLPLCFSKFFVDLGRRMAARIKGDKHAKNQNKMLSARHPHLLDAYNEQEEVRLSLNEMRTEFTPSEFYLFVGGYNGVQPVLFNWRSLKSSGGDESELLRLEVFVVQRSTEMSTFINDCLRKSSITKAASSFCWKMKGDFLRYCAEVTDEGTTERRLYEDDSLAAYKMAEHLAGSLEDGRLFKLGLNLSIAILYHSIFQAPQSARLILQTTLRNVVNEADNKSKQLLQNMLAGVQARC